MRPTLRLLEPQLPTNRRIDLCWLRRDLRLHDNHALFQALQGDVSVACVFIFDPQLLDELEQDSKQVAFMYACLQSLQNDLRRHGSELIIAYGPAERELPRLARQCNSQIVYANRDYEPYTKHRDHLVGQSLLAQACTLQLYKDQVIFEQDEVLTGQGAPYSVFTPYWRKWLLQLGNIGVPSFDSLSACHRLLPLAPLALPSLTELGFSEHTLTKLLIQAGSAAAQEALQKFSTRLHLYEQNRDFPAVNGVSRLSPHLRFGTLSIRQCVEQCWPSDSAGASCWLKELAWRDFYQQFLWHYPDTATQSFKSEYQNLEYSNNEDWWLTWCTGQTGYPLIDAAQRQLLHSGYMHNRLRMISASFLVKDLLIDWRRGERFFAQHLIDYDQAANVGGWQWAASTGCDAQPYFRIFNPITQSQKFDPKGDFIRRYVPELAALDNKSIHAPWLSRQLPLEFRLGLHYPAPIVDHSTQRELALALYKRSSDS